MMKNALTKLEVIDYYFSKIENFLGKKHKNLLNKESKSNCGDSIYSGSPRSSTSDRLHTVDDEESKERDMELGGGFEITVQSVEKRSTQTSLRRNSNIDIEDTDIETNSGKSQLTEKNIMALNDENVMFKDFAEPDVIKTGYLITLGCGHNLQFSQNEKTFYELHLTNAGFIQEQIDESLLPNEEDLLDPSEQ